MYSFTADEMGFVIAPTMDCNAYCFYCYENETRRAFYMNEKTENALIKYIKNITIGKKRLFISWFGGEPLLCKDLIVRVSKELIQFSDENGIMYHSEMTTNGYYLGEIADELKVLRISDIQITLDGFKDEYEKRKNYQVNNAWKTVIGNIYRISKSGVHITVRFNFDKENKESVKEATTFLISQKDWNHNIAIYYYPLEPNGIDNSNYYNEQEYKDVMTELYTHLYESGYYVGRTYALDFHKLSLPCYGATLGTVAVDYYGKIYQCQHLLCHDEYAIGDVFEGIAITQQVNNWYDGTVSEKCQECEVLPLCQGGCVTKPKIGQQKYICHMMKYRLEIQEKLKVLYYRENLSDLD